MAQNTIKTAEAPVNPRALALTYLRSLRQAIVEARRRPLQLKTAQKWLEELETDPKVAGVMRPDSLKHLADTITSLGERYYHLA